MKYLVVISTLLFFGVGCTEVRPQAQPLETPGITSMAEKITFTTSDGVKIIGDYVPGTNSKAVLLLHMMPATRIAWRPLVEKLTVAGFTSLAIDFRGHGESIQTTDGRKLDYRNFSDEEQQAKIKDIEAAVAWLAEKGIGEEKLALIGASIGANLSLQYLAEHEKVPTSVLLSPGLVYRGVETKPRAEALRSNQSVFYVAAKDDDYSALTVGALHEATKVGKKLILYDYGDHGTNMFDAHPELIGEIVDWLQKRIQS